jgi:hypothetical protein
MTNYNRMYVFIALGAMAYWARPVEAQVGLREPNNETTPFDIIKPPAEAGIDTSTTGGDTAHNGTTSYNQVIVRKGISTYPVPATTYFIVDVGPEHQTALFDLYTMTGQLVRRFRASDQVDVSALKPGTYFIRPNNAALPFRSTKILVN